MNTLDAANLDRTVRRTAAVAKPSRSASGQGATQNLDARRNVVAVAAGLRHSRGPAPPDIVWSAAPSGLKPAEGAVDVFCAPLDVPAKRLEELSQHLSPDEWRRAGRIHHERDWRHFLIGRGTLREILGLLLNVKPASLEFSNGIFGKPQIAAPVAGQSLHFNVAHSDSLVVYATSRRELGVDIEHIREMDEADQIASRFFSPRETNCLHGLPAEQRLEAFFNCWTRKEAYLKAIGRGLDDNIDQIEVSLAPGEPAELLGTPHASRQWSLHTLAPAPEFVGALAVQEPDSRVNCWRWTGPGALQ